MTKGAIVSRAEDFPRWYQEVIAGAEMADNGPARGTMVIRDLSALRSASCSCAAAIEDHFDIVLHGIYPPPV